MTAIRVIDKGDAVRVEFPGKALDVFESSGIAQAVDLPGPGVPPAHEEYDLAETWRCREVRRRGRHGSTIVLELGHDSIADLITYLEAYVAGARDSEEHAELRALRLGLDRLFEAQRMLREANEGRPVGAAHPG